MSRAFRISLALVAATFAVSANAADLPPDVLAKSSRMTITRSDFDAELAEAPPDIRNSISASPDRLTKIMNSMLETKTLAGEARANGLDKDPAIAARIARQTERVLALARGAQIEQEAAAAFDRRRDEFKSRARETYLLNKDKYTLPEKIRASHILIKVDKRSQDDALALASKVRAQALAEGADFAALARQYSEDQTVKSNSGSLGWFDHQRMQRTFTIAAFALQKSGDISEPVLSPFGYHIIKLEGRQPAELQPYEKVQDQVMADLKDEYIAAARIQASKGIATDPTLQLNQPAIDALVVKTDPDVARRAGTLTPPGK